MIGDQSINNSHKSKKSKKRPTVVTPHNKNYATDMHDVWEMLELLSKTQALMQMRLNALEGRVNAGDLP